MRCANIQLVGSCGVDGHSNALIFAWAIAHERLVVHQPTVLGSRGGDGSVVRKGQKIFAIDPDELVVEESDQEIRERRQTVTLELLS